MGYEAKRGEDMESIAESILLRGIRRVVGSKDAAHVFVERANERLVD